MGWKQIVAVAAVFTATACGAPEDEAFATEEQAAVKRRTTSPTPAPAPTPVAAVQFTSDDPAGAFLRSTEFALAATPQVSVVVDWTGFPAGAVQRLDLVAPSGRVYASSLQAIPAGGRVVYTLQVAGTTIETYQMVGTWTAQVRLESDRTPRTVSVFTLY